MLRHPKSHFSSGFYACTQRLSPPPPGITLLSVPSRDNYCSVPIFLHAVVPLHHPLSLSLSIQLPIFSPFFPLPSHIHRPLPSLLPLSLPAVPFLSVPFTHSFTLSFTHSPLSRVAGEINYHAFRRQIPFCLLPLL